MENASRSYGTYEGGRMHFVESLNNIGLPDSVGHRARFYTLE